MYLSYYDLQRMPFQVSTDPAFFWLGEEHQEALTILKYGILENKGILLLTGDVGTGKTTLINALVGTLEDLVTIARVPDPGMCKLDLMNYIANALNIGSEFTRKDLFLVHLENYLRTAHAKNKKVLLIIDESQRMSGDLVEEVRQWTNIEEHEAKLLNIFLIGQNEFNTTLQEDINRPLLQRIALTYRLKPLDLYGTGELIKHRLKVAGASKEIFDTGAIEAVYDMTEGIPRRIIILCDLCLLYGYVQQEKVITASMVIKSSDQLVHPAIIETPEVESYHFESSIDPTADSESTVIPPHANLNDAAIKQGAPTTRVLLSLAVILAATLFYFANEDALRSTLSQHGAQIASAIEGYWVQIPQHRVEHENLDANDNNKVHELTFTTPQFHPDTKLGSITLKDFLKPAEITRDSSDSQNKPTDNTDSGKTEKTSTEKELRASAIVIDLTNLAVLTGKQFDESQSTTPHENVSLPTQEEKIVDAWKDWKHRKIQSEATEKYTTVAQKSTYANVDNFKAMLEELHEIMAYGWFGTQLAVVNDMNQRSEKHRGKSAPEEKDPIQFIAEETGEATDLFSKMELYLASKNSSQRQEKAKEPPPQKTRVVDSGKVFDWILEKKSKNSTE